MARCCAKTKRGEDCLIFADREHGGVPYCHVHDPAGIYQQQVRARRAKRQDKRNRKRKRGNAAKTPEKQANRRRRTGLYETDSARLLEKLAKMLRLDHDSGRYYIEVIESMGDREVHDWLTEKSK